MSSDPVRTLMLNLMDALIEDVAHAEALADELVEGAASLSDQSGPGSIRDAAIRWRVRSIELQGQLAAMREDYRSRFHEPPDR